MVRPLRMNPGLVPPVRGGIPHVRAVLLLLIPALLLAAAPALAGSEPRTDPATGWITQDWPQRALNPEAGSLFSAPFRIVDVDDPPVPPPAWLQTGDLGLIPGAPATEYMSALGPYGTMFHYEGRYIVARLTPSGALTSSVNTGCDLVGTPLVFPRGNSLVVVTAGKNCSTLGIYRATGTSRTVRTWVSAPSPGHMEQVVTVDFSMPRTNLVELDDKSYSTESPAKKGAFIYAACNNLENKKPGNLFCVTAETMTQKWKSPLQTGKDLGKPIPRGQEPPAAEEVYQPTTSPVIKGDLVVIGTVRIKDVDGKKEGDQVEGALFGFNVRDGSQRWVYRTKGRVLPHPAITPYGVVFGNDKGQAFSVGPIDGKRKWATQEAARIRVQNMPVLSPQNYSDAGLYGPAVDAAAKYAYFSGSDGRVHRFEVQSGAHFQSEILLLYLAIKGNSADIDTNGQPLFRPCPMHSPPAIADNSATGSFLVVKSGTESKDSFRNSSFLHILRIPDLRMNSGLVSGFAPGTVVDPLSGQFFSPGPGAFGTMSLESLVGYWYTIVYRAVYAVTYVDGYEIDDDNPHDTGGVSITNGFVLATDRHANVVGIPSSQSQTTISGVGGITPAPGAPSYITPPPLGPVRVYPNPFDPGHAAGGVAKFRNLPAGSVVELWTLAFERVRSMAESGNLVLWDGTNEAGQKVATGVYLYIIRIPGQPEVRGRLALVRK